MRYFIILLVLSTAVGCMSLPMANKTSGETLENKTIQRTEPLISLFYTPRKNLRAEVI